MDKTPPVKIGKVVKKKRREEEKRKDNLNKPAFMGRPDGTVLVADRPYFVWVTTPAGETFQAYNGKVQNIPGTAVWVGRDPLMPRRIQVMGYRDVGGSNVAGVAVASHALTHAWGGTDPVRIWGEQIMPGRVYPAGGLIVRVFRGVYYLASTYVSIVDQDVDLTASKPGSTGARWVLVAAKNDGTIDTTDGSIAASRGALTLADIPAPAAGTFPLAAVVLENTSTQLRQGLTATDFLDLRFGGFASNAGDAVTLGGQAPAYYLKARRPLFDHFADAGNTGTGETDLYSDTIAAGQLAANGDKLAATYAGIFVSSATATRQLRAYFGGTLIFDSTALATTSAEDWTLDVTIVRESSSVVRVISRGITSIASAIPPATYTRITGLTLSGTEILKITGTAAGVGAATDDIVAKIGSTEHEPAA